jgi:hypothetical protein
VFDLPSRLPSRLSSPARTFADPSNVGARLAAAEAPSALLRRLPVGGLLSPRRRAPSRFGERGAPRARPRHPGAATPSDLERSEGSLGDSRDPSGLRPSG